MNEKGVTTAQKFVELGSLFNITAGGDWDKARFTKFRTVENTYPVFGNSLGKNDVLGWSPYFKIQGNSLTITGRGDVGNAIYRDISFVPIVRLIACYPRSEKTDSYFYASYLNMYGSFHLESTGVPQLTAPQASRVLVPEVDSVEQKAVTGALKIADRYLDSLEGILSKKRAIKQGLMQELLTGKTRLPGVDSKWKKSSFGAELEFLRGSMATKELKHGRIPLIAAGIKPAGFVNKANRRGPIITISSSGANAGFVGWHVSDIWASDCTTVSRARGLDLKLAFYLLVYMQDSIYKSQTGGAQPHVHAKDVAPIEIRFPSDPLEQSAVVEVIDAADAEIQALEEQLESAKAIKQGMMQELLTGRTRLPKEGQ